MSQAKDVNDAVRVVVLDHLDADLDFMTIGEVLGDEGFEYDDDFLEDVFEAASEELRSIKRSYSGGSY